MHEMGGDQAPPFARLECLPLVPSPLPQLIFAKPQRQAREDDDEYWGPTDECHAGQEILLPKGFSIHGCAASPLYRASCSGLILPSSGQQMARNQIESGRSATERPLLVLCGPSSYLSTRRLRGFLACPTTPGDRSKIRPFVPTAHHSPYTVSGTLCDKRDLNLRRRSRLFNAASCARDNKSLP